MNDTLFNPVNETLVVDNKNLGNNKYSAEGTVAVIEYNPNSIILNANSNEKQFLVISEVYYPAGWNTYLNGELVTTHQVNHILRGIELPAGENKVELIFESPTYNTAVALSWTGNLLSIFLLIFFGYTEFYKKQKSNG
jgi:uncharacterized membrane protein YfhO